MRKGSKRGAVRITARLVHRLAVETTPTQVAELLAIRLAMFYRSRTPLLQSHWRDPDIQPLIRRRMITWRRVNGWSARYRMPTLTELGERVLLDLAEDAMVRVGVCAPFTSADDDGDDDGS